MISRALIRAVRAGGFLLLAAEWLVIGAAMAFVLDDSGLHTKFMVPLDEGSLLNDR